jgi:hypothetical protein
MKTSNPKLNVLLICVIFYSCIRTTAQLNSSTNHGKQANDTLQLSVDGFNETIGDSVFSFVEEMPEFAGGQEAMMKFLSIASVLKDTIETGCGSRLIIQFIVTKTGKTINPKIILSACPEIDQQYIRIIKSFPEWKPGKHKGKPVNFRFMMPILICLKE